MMSLCITSKIYFQFISGDVIGLFGYGFCDFGMKFEVMDTNGEEAREVFICNITKVRKSPEYENFVCVTGWNYSD